MKIDVLCTRELDFEGSGSQNRSILMLFLQGVKNVFFGGSFCDFDDFGLPGGIPKGSFYAKKAFCWGSVFLMIFGQF